MAIDVLALASAKKYTNLVALGLTNVSVDDTAKTITFTTNDEQPHTIHFTQPSDGVSITGVTLDESTNEMTVSFSNDTSQSIGVISTVQGYTPVKGTDYWTSEDIATIHDYIDTRIGGVLDGSY